LQAIYFRVDKIRIGLRKNIAGLQWARAEFPGKPCEMKDLKNNAAQENPVESMRYSS
jgi:hypothetical protein